MTSSAPSTSSILVLFIVAAHAVVYPALNTPTVDDSRTEGDRLVKAAICQTRLWTLVDTAVTVPFIPSPLLASQFPFVRFFSPSKGTLAYVCDERDEGEDIIEGTVKAFLQMINSDPSDVNLDDIKNDNTLEYEAGATLHLASRTITHCVTRSNRAEYVGKKLHRRIRFKKRDNLLTLIPQERMFGFEFALLWAPSDAKTVQSVDMVQGAGQC